MVTPCIIRSMHDYSVNKIKCKRPYLYFILKTEDKYNSNKTSYLN